MRTAGLIFPLMLVASIASAHPGYSVASPATITAVKGQRLQVVVSVDHAHQPGKVSFYGFRALPQHDYNFVRTGMQLKLQDGRPAVSIPVQPGPSLHTLETTFADLGRHLSIQPGGKLYLGVLFDLGNSGGQHAWGTNDASREVSFTIPNPVD